MPRFRCSLKPKSTVNTGAYTFNLSVKSSNLESNSLDRIVDVLREETTGFLLVTTPCSSTVRASENLIFQLREFDFQLSGAIVNQCLPKAVTSDLKTGGSGACHWQALLCARWQDELDQQAKIKSFLAPKLSLTFVEEQPTEIKDINTLLKFSHSL